MRWRNWALLVCAVGAIREGWFYLVHEPMTVPRPPRIGSEFEPLRPLISGAKRIGYLSDEPLDAVPDAPREHGWADMKYGHAQYALAPVVLAHGDASCPLLLANFAEPAALQALLASGRYRVVAAVSPTIALLGRR